jgi:hypothetical protein
LYISYVFGYIDLWQRERGKGGVFKSHDHR